ncbi:helix-turn-helix domain-containing protein [Weeksellaceae bacterium TAE3-ERU29]|nr:helix-turn-helix domain-containing protein [Weeksellaceae bacterium TAE3-ERU29]
MDKVEQKLAKKIKVLRKEKGWSQERLAFEANIDRTYVQSIEKGERNVSLKILAKLSEAFGITISMLTKDL